MQDVLNTPRYYYIIAYILSAFVVVSVNEKKVRGVELLAVGCVWAAVLTAFMTWTDGIRQALFLPCVAVIVSIIYLFIYGVSTMSRRESGFYCAKAFINGEFAASFCWQVFYHLAPRFEAHINLWRWGELAVFFAGIFGIFYLIEKYLKKDMDEIQVTRRELLVAVIVAVSVFGVSNLSYVDTGGLFSGSLAKDIFTIRTLADLSGVAVLYAFHIQLKEMQLRFEKDTMQNIMNLQYQNYQISRENIDMVNRKYHDLKHQIVLLKAQSGSGKSTEYLEQMEREIKGYEAQNRTGNPVLDAVLSSKSLVCQTKGIELKFIADGAALSFMEDMDVSALFGNMLDNAIESAQKQENPGQRLVWLYVTREKHFVRIRTENYCSETIQFRNGMPVTTKADKHLHGFGMKSIRATVEKYGGSVVASQQDGWFQLKILIPEGTEKI